MTRRKSRNLRPIRIGVKLCGHCNPSVDGSYVLAGIRIEGREIVFQNWQAPDNDLLLIFSGCPSDCTESPAFDGPVIRVAAQLVDDAERLAEEIRTKIRSAF